MRISTGSKAAVAVAPVCGEQEGRHECENGRGRGGRIFATEGSGAIQTGETQGSARTDLCKAIACGVAQRGAWDAHGKACCGDNGGWGGLVVVVVGVGMERRGGGA